MAVAYASHYSTRTTPQSEPIPGSNQIQNSAGGYAYPVDDWVKFDRFLILGCEGGSYYASEKKLVLKNAQAIQKCLDLDPVRAIARIIEISETGRAPKNDPAIFALAIASGHEKARMLAVAAIPRVCRIGTHLFTYIQAVQAFRGWGRNLRRAIGAWYTEKSPSDLAYQVVKYQSRNGWSHRDVLRLAHPKASGSIQDILHWCVRGWPGVGVDEHPDFALKRIWAMETAKRATTVAQIVKLIGDHGLVRECIPTKFLNAPEVWEALLEEMPLAAMVRNLATMTRVGLLSVFSNAEQKVVGRLLDQNYIKASRLHPIAILAALKTYQSGHGDRGKHSWVPNVMVVDALDRAFYLSFGNVPVTGKRWLFGLDVSGSMDGGTVAGVNGLTPRIASAALALVTAAVEPNHLFVAFTNGGYCVGSSMHSGWRSGVTPLSISPRQRLDDVCRTMAALPMGGTDCALPMIYASEQKLSVDVFVVLTDSETWANPVLHPSQALTNYRQKIGINAKMITVGMVANEFSVADQNDAGMLDVVGFDVATPTLMADFVAH